MSQRRVGGARRDVGVVIAAGGVGQRAGRGEPKQFRPIAGVPMLLRAVRPFAQHPRVLEIAVALPPPFASDPPEWLRALAGERLRVVAGGATRAASVRAGLGTLAPECAVVLVHDAARPFVPRETIDGVLDAAARGVAATAAIPVTDTLKRVAPGTMRVAETLSRNGLWRAQTPQGFPRAVLEHAFTAAGDHLTATDEAALVEAAGYVVEIVPDRVTNLKITTADDFALAEALARA